MSKANPPNSRRGEVWNVDFNSTIGSEIQKIRPAVVISSNGVGVLPIKVVVPITGWQDRFLRNIWHVAVEPNATNGLRKVSAVDVMQIRAVAEERFLEKLGTLNASLMQEITAAIAAVIEYE